MKEEGRQLGHWQEEVWKTVVAIETCRANFPGGQGRAISEVGSGVPELGEICQVLSIQGCTVINVIKKYRRCHDNSCR